MNYYKQTNVDSVSQVKLVTVNVGIFVTVDDVACDLGDRNMFNEKHR